MIEVVTPYRKPRTLRTNLVADGQKPVAKNNMVAAQSYTSGLTKTATLQPRTLAISPEFR